MQKNRIGLMRLKMQLMALNSGQSSGFQVTSSGDLGLSWAQVEPGGDLAIKRVFGGGRDFSGTLRPSLAHLLHSSAPAVFPLRLLGSGVRLGSVESVGPQRPVLLTGTQRLCVKCRANY